MSSATLFVWAWRGQQEGPHPRPRPRHPAVGGEGALAGRRLEARHPPSLDLPGCLGQGAHGRLPPPCLLPSLLVLQSSGPPPRRGLARASLRASVCVCVAVPSPAARRQRQLSRLRAPLRGSGPRGRVCGRRPAGGEATPPLQAWARRLPCSSISSPGAAWAPETRPRSAASVSGRQRPGEGAGISSRKRQEKKEQDEKAAKLQIGRASCRERVSSPV